MIFCVQLAQHAVLMRHSTKLQRMDHILIMFQFILTVLRKVHSDLRPRLVHYSVKTWSTGGGRGLLCLSFLLSGSTWDLHKWMTINFTFHINSSLDLCPDRCAEAAALYIKSDDLWLELLSLVNPITRPIFGIGAELFPPVGRKEGPDLRLSG